MNHEVLRAHFIDLFRCQLFVMGDPTNLEEKLNFFMQRCDACLNSLARQISKLVQTFNKGGNQNQSGSDHESFGQQTNEKIEVPVVL